MEIYIFFPKARTSNYDVYLVASQTLYISYAIPGVSAQQLSMIYEVLLGNQQSETFLAILCGAEYQNNF